MAEAEGVTVHSAMENMPDKNANMDICEPEAKKQRLGDKPMKQDDKLQERLNGILCCAVCLDLPLMQVYQCSNGHLMCASCMSHLLADARLKDETATCPNCRCEISKGSCIRNLAVEKAIAELPTTCQFCSQQLPRSALSHHETDECIERLVQCPYERIGCPWRGPAHEHKAHEAICAHPEKTGKEVMSAVQALDQLHCQELQRYKQIFDFLSFEKVTFSDVQLRPYRTDDFITKLYYESSRFSAFNSQWVVKARVNDHHKNPTLTSRRMMTFQLVLKSKTQNPINVRYMTLSGPYGDMSMKPAVYNFEFNSDSTETEYKELPLIDSVECNKLLAARNINLRLILCQMQK